MLTLSRLACFACLMALFHLAHSAAPDKTKQGDVQPLSSGDNKPSGSPTFLSASSIEAGTADTKGTLSIVGYLPMSVADEYFVHYQVNGEAPLSTKGSTDAVDIGTVSGLTAGSSATADISIMDWPHAADKPVADLTSLCKEEVPKLVAAGKGGVQYTWEQISDWSDSKEVCSRAVFNTSTLQSMVDGLNARLKKCDPPSPPLPKSAGQDEIARAAAEKQVCDTLKNGGGARLTEEGRDSSNLKRLLAKIGDLERAANVAVTIVSFGPKVNRQKVAYFDKGDLSTLNKTNTTGYGAHFTISQIRGNLMYSGGFSYEKSYKSDDAVQVCSPVSGSTSLKCPQGSIGAPTRTFGRILFTEARYLFSSGAFALSPRLEYDFTASKFAAKLPVYFAPNKDKALTGGITLGYVTHGDGFGVSVFVNKAFSLF
jgi:hypothetical protein